jgi:hypothetical protein
MLTRLTLASNSCNPGNRAGDHSMSGKVPRISEPSRPGGPRAKVRTVKAGLPEPQTLGFESGSDTRMVNVSFGAGGRPNQSVGLNGSAIMFVSRLHPNHATHPLSEGYGRTGHLNAPHLLYRVTTGSPKRAALNSPAWRRSSHSSQRPGVTPGTAAGRRTAVAETDRATGRGTPANRVKGNASAGPVRFMTVAS